MMHPETPASSWKESGNERENEVSPLFNRYLHDVIKHLTVS
jgi:hypothetical protein